MEEGNMTQGCGNSSIINTDASPSYSPEAISVTDLALGCFILVFFLVGTAVNGLIHWVLRVKMVRTINTFWFLHLNRSYLICCLTLPFYAVNYLYGRNWIFGVAMCKLNTMFFSLGMFSAVFLLTVISFDRYLFTCHPTWSRHHRTLPWAQRLVTGTWLASLALISPYLAFMDIKKVQGMNMCISNYALSSDWGVSTPDLKYRVALAFFVLRFLLAFLLPFIIIVTCYCCMGQEMRRRLVRTGKPYKILVTAVASFFICRLPFYLFNASLLFSRSKETQEALRVIYIICMCLNICCTPMSYLFVGEKFQNVFKMSTVSLLKRGFPDLPTMHGESEKAVEEGHQNNHSGSLTQKLTQGNDQTCNDPLHHV